MATVSFRRGRWILDFADQNGQRQRITCKKGTKKSDADQLLAEKLKEVDAGTFAPDKENPSFSEVADEWLKRKNLDDIEDSTLEMYKGHVENHLKPVFGKKRVKRIRYRHVEQFVYDKIENSKLSRNTIKKITRTLSDICGFAVRNEWMAINPCNDLPRLPTIIRQADKKEKVEQYLTKEQVEALLEAEKDPKYRTLYTVAAWAGPREGELLGLEWRDFLPKKRVLRIRRTYNHGKIRKCKTESSVRDIDLFSFVAQALREWKLQSPFSKDNDAIFPNKIGGRMDARNMFQRHFKKTLKAAKLPDDTQLPDIRFHDLRHTYASLMLDMGMDFKYLQVQMGHSDIKTTLNTYAHLIKKNRQGRLREIEKKIEDKKNDGHNSVTEV